MNRANSCHTRTFGALPAAASAMPMGVGPQCYGDAGGPHGHNSVACTGSARRYYRRRWAVQSTADSVARMEPL